MERTVEATGAEVDSRWARVARGATAAAFATFVAALSHTAAGGSTPSVVGIAASLLLSVAVSTVLAGRAPALWRLAASVAVSQVLFHFVFSSVGAPVVAPHVHHVERFAPEAVHAHASTMWFAHVLAGLVTIVAFRYGESALRGLRDTLRLFVVRLVTAPSVSTAPEHPAARVSADRVFVPRERTLFLSPMRHRGPPALSA